MSDRDPSYRKPVCLIHGIESDGAWRNLVREVLEPHFRCVPLDHDHFARLGWAKIFVPWLRKQSVQHVFRQYSDQVPAGSAHLIAHSFGTWISSRLMTKTSLVRFDRVVFAGSPPCPRASTGSGCWRGIRARSAIFATRSATRTWSSRWPAR